MARPTHRRTVWTVLFGETIMTWPRILIQQVMVVYLVMFATGARSSWSRWIFVTWAVVLQVWVGYDATQRLRATDRARHAQTPATSPSVGLCPDAPAARDATDD